MRIKKLKLSDLEIGGLYKYCWHPYNIVMIHHFNRDTVKYEYLDENDSNIKIRAAITRSFLAYYSKVA